MLVTTLDSDDCVDEQADRSVIYSRTSMAQTSLGPWKFVRDMGSSSH